MSIAVDQNGNVDMAENSKEIRDYVREENPTYREFKDKYDGFRAAGLTQGPTSVVKEDESKIYLGDADFEMVGQALNEQEEFYKPSKTRAGWALGSMGTTAGSVFKLLETGNPNWLTAAGVAILAG
ncbi:MAG: hypothetical protein ABEJ56_02475 [Candidatus Nanohaloarchaea archaeon]